MKPDFELAFTYGSLPILRSLKSGSYFAHGFLIIAAPGRTKTEAFIEGAKNLALRGAVYRALRVTPHFYETLKELCREHQATNPFTQSQ